ARFQSRLIIVLATTNVPHLVDPALLRRTGGTIERFGRLSRKGFAAVLEKHIAGLPIAAMHGDTQHQRERRLLGEVADWIFCPNGQDPGQVELVYAGSAQAVTFHRRDLLTAALVDRAVQQTAVARWRGTRNGEPPCCTSRA